MRKTGYIILFFWIAYLPFSVEARHGKSLKLAVEELIEEGWLSDQETGRILDIYYNLLGDQAIADHCGASGEVDVIEIPPLPCATGVSAQTNCIFTNVKLNCIFPVKNKKSQKGKLLAPWIQCRIPEDSCTKTNMNYCLGYTEPEGDNKPDMYYTEFEPTRYSDSNLNTKKGISDE